MRRVFSSIKVNKPVYFILLKIKLLSLIRLCSNNRLPDHEYGRVLYRECTAVYCFTAFDKDVIIIQSCSFTWNVDLNIITVNNQEF